MADFVKDPSAVLDYQRNWSVWLGTDTITASTWIVPKGMTAVSDAFTTTTCTVFLGGGKVGVTYMIPNHIVTEGGREDTRSFTIEIKNR